MTLVATDLPRLLVRLVLAGVGLALIASVALDSADAGVDPTEGRLSVRLEPPVPAQIFVDGVPRDTWSLTDLDLDEGPHIVSFADVPGFATPEDFWIDIEAGDSYNLIAHYGVLHSLRVTTSPPVDGTIFVDGYPKDQWGLWTYVEPGSHRVCFGPVPGMQTPPCQPFDNTSQAHTEIIGEYVPAANSHQSLPTGRLRVESDPPVPTTVLVDGVPASDWGLRWLALPQGVHWVSFTDVPGFVTPEPQLVTIVANQTSTITADFEPLTQLRVTIDPPVPMTVTVDGVPRNRWGMWTGLEPGTYEVCLEQTIGWNPPPCEQVTLSGAPVHLTMTPTPRPVHMSGPISALIHPPLPPASLPASGPQTIRIDIEENLLHQEIQIRIDNRRTTAICHGVPFQTFCTVWVPMSPPIVGPERVDIRTDHVWWTRIGIVAPQ